jgi:hypothetical protein
MSAGRFGPTVLLIMTPFSVLAAERRVTASIDGADDPGVIERAKTQASQAFEVIGVRLDWHRHSSPCRADRSQHIRIRLITTAPDYHRGALAHAFVYEGANIEVFYDRVRKAIERQSVPILLAHVLIHEITHMLQGIERHADSGVMKGHWSYPDFVRMKNRTLPFTAEDILFIHRGIDGRRALTAASAHAPSNVRSYAALASAR